MLRTASTEILQRSNAAIRRSFPLFWPVVRPRDCRAVALRFRSSGNSDFRGKITNLFEQTSKQASELAKEQTGRAMERLEDQGKQALKIISHKAQTASDTLVAEARTAYQKGAVSAKDVMRKSSQQATEKLQSTVSDTGRVLSQTTKGVVNATSERIRTSSVGVVTQARAMGTKAIRWAALWSLAAIFVYGVATSIPTALIQHAFSGKETSKKTEPSSDEQPIVTKRWWA